MRTQQAAFDDVDVCLCVYIYVSIRVAASLGKLTLRWPRATFRPGYIAVLHSHVRRILIAQFIMIAICAANQLTQPPPPV